jgi:hypothetical protein
VKNKLIQLNFELSSEFFHFSLCFKIMFSDVIKVDYFQVQVDGRLLEIVDDDWRKVPYTTILKHWIIPDFIQAIEIHVKYPRFGNTVTKLGKSL